MTLLVDAGNSAIKWAQLVAGARLDDPQWQLHRRVPDVASTLIERWRGYASSGSGVIACNVAGAEVAAAIDKAALTLGFGTVCWLQTQPRFDGVISLVNGYRDPLRLGADRWHCMLGACSIAAAPLMVVNAGTATTVDCVEREEATAEHSVGRFAGKFIGGFIAPGMRLMLESLARETAGLPSARGAAAAFPDNTDAAIVSGVLEAQAGLVHQVWQRFAARLNATPRLILTGGSAAELMSRLAIKTASIEHNLVLRGLALRASMTQYQ